MLAVLCQAQAAIGDQVIDRFVILVHPCAYDAIGTPLSDPYRAREEEVRNRWAGAITPLPPSTFVVQVDYAQNHTANQLHQWFVDKLGAGRVTRIPVRVVGSSTPGPLKEYYEDINRQIRRQIAAQGLTFDPATVKTIIWGESFEGCAAGYGSAIASYLGLKTPTRFDYKMSVPDAPFLLKATFLQTVPIPASDVEAYLFDLNDGRCAAFFRSTLTPQWLDHRYINLLLDSEIFSVVTKQDAAVVWPQSKLPTGSRRFILSTVQARFLIVPKSHVAELLSVIKGATVGPETGLVDTFSRADDTSLGYAESPASMYQWISETTLNTGAAADAAEIVGDRLHLLDTNRQVVVDVNFKDVSVGVDVMFDTAGDDGGLPKGDAGITLRKPTLKSGAWDAPESVGKVAIEVGPSGLIRVIEVPTGGGRKTLAEVNPWTKSTSWSCGPTGSLPTTVNGLPFDANADGRLSGEVFKLGATLIGHDLSVLINGQTMLSLTVAGTGNSGHNYVSLFSNQIGSTGRTHVYFDDVRVRVAGADREGSSDR